MTKLVYKSVERPAAPTKPAQQGTAGKFGRHSRMPFGKHKGKTIIAILVEDVRYITWALENVAGFVLDDDAQAAYEAFKE